MKKKASALAALVAMLTFALVACGSSSASTTGDNAADISAAKQATIPYTHKPSVFPVDAPLGRPLPAGTKFAYLQCAAGGCALAATALKGAVQAIGGELTIVNAGSSASSLQSAASTVLAMKPAAVFVVGMSPSLFGDSLKQLSSAGIKVISVSITGDTKSYGIDFNFPDDRLFELSGRLIADWAIAKEGAHAEVAFYGVPEVELSHSVQAGFEQEMKAKCPGCTVRAVQISVATLGTTAPRTVVNDLQAHPHTKLGIFAIGSAAGGLAPAMKIAGLSVDTFAFSPLPAQLQDIKDGRMTAALGLDQTVAVWTAVDGAARLILGEPLTKGEQAGLAPIQFLAKDDITFDPTNGWTGYADYAKRFAQLWSPAS